MTGLETRGDGWRLETRGPDGVPTSLRAERVVNAAGLSADRVAALAGLPIDALGWRQHLCKGDYFAVAPGFPATDHLVYPVPVGAGLGIHTTLDLGGRMRLGPDATYVDRASLDVDPRKAQAFAEAAGRYLPGLRPEHLTPDMAGLRPKLAGPGEPFHDFVCAESSAHGAPGMVHLVGIESPGLTASEALAHRAADPLQLTKVSDIFVNSEEERAGELLLPGPSSGPNRWRGA